MDDYVKVKKIWFYIGVVVLILSLMYVGASILGFMGVPIGGVCHLVCEGGPMI